jgi:hypothetical protein
VAIASIVDKGFDLSKASPHGAYGKGHYFAGVWEQLTAAGMHSKMEKTRGVESSQLLDSRDQKVLRHCRQLLAVSIFVPCTY